MRRDTRHRVVVHATRLPRRVGELITCMTYRLHRTEVPAFLKSVANVIDGVIGVINWKIFDYRLLIQR